MNKRGIFVEDQREVLSCLCLFAICMKQYWGLDTEFSLQTRPVLNFSVLLADPGSCFRSTEAEGGGRGKMNEE